MYSPFTYGTLVTRSQFLNRKNEKKRIVSNLESGISTILISPRRWGKSSLVKEVAETIPRKSNFIFVFIDLFTIKNEQEFYQKFSTEVIKAGSSKTEVWLGRAKKFLGNLLPYFSVSLDPNSEVSLKLDYQNEIDPDNILDLPEKLSVETGKRFIVCLDEFQNIDTFNDPLAFQKKLRSFWQQHSNAVYLLYGSKRHMMQQLFFKRSYPFYKFGDVLFIEKIDVNEWVPFIQKKFEEQGKSISKELAAELVESVESHTQYVQQLAHNCFLNTTKGGKVNEAILESATEELILQNRSFCQMAYDQMSQQQVAFIKMLMDGVESGFTKNDNLKKYGIKSSSAVPKIIAALEKKEIIDRLNKVEFTDPVFKLYLKSVLK